MNSSHLRSTVARSPGGTAGGNTLTATYAGGGERVVVGFVGPAALTLTLTRTDATVLLKRPLPIQSLVSPPAGKDSLVHLMKMSSALVTAARSAILATQRPTDPSGALFYDGQRRIFVDSFTGDSMDDDDLINLPADG